MTAIGQKADAYAHGLSPAWPFQARLKGVVCGGSVKEPSDRVIVEAIVVGVGGARLLFLFPKAVGKGI